MLISKKMVITCSIFLAVFMFAIPGTSQAISDTMVVIVNNNLDVPVTAVTTQQACMSTMDTSTYTINPGDQLSTGGELSGSGSCAFRNSSFHIDLRTDSGTFATIYMSKKAGHGDATLEVASSSGQFDVQSNKVGISGGYQLTVTVNPK